MEGILSIIGSLVGVGISATKIGHIWYKRYYLKRKKIKASINIYIKELVEHIMETNSILSQCIINENHTKELVYNLYKLCYLFTKIITEDFTFIYLLNLLETKERIQAIKIMETISKNIYSIINKRIIRDVFPIDKYVFISNYDLYKISIEDNIELMSMFEVLIELNQEMINFISKLPEINKKVICSLNKQPSLEKKKSAVNIIEKAFLKKVNLKVR